MDEVHTELWDSDHIHYRISAFGRHYHLNLSLDAGFIAPLYTVTVLGANRTDAEGEGEEEDEEEEDTELRHCFYRGHVDAREQHAAVISLCSGLVSFYARPHHAWLFHSVHCRCSQTITSTISIKTELKCFDVSSYLFVYFCARSSFIYSWRPFVVTQINNQ